MNTFTRKLPLTLHKLYGDRVVFTSRPSFGKNPWLTTEYHQANMLTARELLIADMPVILHQAAVGERTRELFAAAGLEMPSNFRTFSTEAEYNARLREAERNGEKIFFQYTHERDYIEPETYRINRDLFVALNNKTKISEWTKGKFLPKREVVSSDQLEEELKAWEYPYVIKPGDDHPTAGGYGVMICFNDDDLKRSLQRIKEAEVDSEFIIEQYVEAKDNYCVQYAYNKELGYQYLGASIQNTERYGKYRGNLTAEHVPQNVIDAGKEIMENGVEAGYEGIAGFDLLTSEDGEVFAIDLNFRQNGSTSLLLINDLLDGSYKKFMGYYAQEVDNHAFFEKIFEEVKTGRLFPLAYYDGEFFEDTAVPSRFVGIWHGDKQDVLQHDENFVKFNKGE